MAALRVGESSRAGEEREFTIRFPQVDPAGIVFYPRYFEMVYRCFPALPFSRAPLAIKTQFLKPNRLGDRITLSFAAGDEWSVSGRIGDAEHFSMRALAIEPPSTTAHAAAESAFTTAERTVGEWMTDRLGHMSLSRYFECLNVAIEEWFEATLGMPFHELHVGREIGIPTVQFVTGVRALPGFGESFAIRIRPMRLGGRAMTFRSWLIGGDGCLVENEQVVVFVRMLPGGYESIGIPGDARDAFGEQLEEGDR